MASKTISDKQLREELTWYGENPGPVTASTRAVLQKKLEKLRKTSPSGTPQSDMSTRSVRRTTTQTVSYGGSSSRSGGASSTSTAEHNDDADDSFDISDVNSPLSPTNRSRQHEKQILSHLNDRLAQYIERVRSLENDKARLTVQIREQEETVTRERTGIRRAYESELNDARKLLDDTAKDKARLQIDADKAKAQYDDLRARIGKLEKDMKSSEQTRMYAESQVQDMTARLNNADNNRKHFEEEAKRLAKENDALKKQLDTAKRQLEEETLLRVDLENRLQSMREELAFNKQLFEQELCETKQKKQREITEERAELENQFENKLQDRLNQLRASFESRITANRTEIEHKYESKLKSMYDEAQRAREGAMGSRDEVKGLRVTIDSLEKERNKFENMVGGLDRKIKDLEESLRVSREDFYNRLNSKEEEIRALQVEIGRSMRDYQDLMDTKIQLDVEIEAYRNLLEVEETRLHLTPTTSPVGTPTKSGDRRGVKRKRVLQERESELFNTFQTKAHHDGDVEIEDHCSDGGYIRLRNRGNKDVKLGGYVLKREAGGSEVSYKFHSKLVIKAGDAVTVWSSSSDETHSPPNTLVMKNQSWPVGDKVRSVLINPEDDEVAWRESGRMTSSQSYKYTGSGVSGLAEDDPNRGCSIM